MKKIILVILALTLLVISCKKKDDDEITGPGNKPPSNYEPPKVDTPEAQGFKTSITTYSGAEIDELISTYTFDASGNLSLAYNNSSRNIPPQTYTFWGADPNNANIGWYYQDNGNYPKAIEYYTDIKGRPAIKYANTDKAEPLMYHTGEFKEPDDSKINDPKTTSADATAWKNSVSGTIKGTYYSDNDASFVFDASKNLTITYKVYIWNDSGMVDTGETETKNYTFWGATKGSDDNTTICGLYYYNSGNYYQRGAFKLDGSKIASAYDVDTSTLMHPEKIVIRADYDKMKPAQTTTANAQAWLTKVKGKAIEERNVIQYTILDNGDIEYNNNREKTTYILFGAKSQTEAIYSYKMNLRQLAESSKAPDMTVYSYIGVILDTTKNEATIKDELSDEYDNKLEDFYDLYSDDVLDDYKPNTDWKSFPLPKSTDVNWNSTYGQVVKNLIKK